MLQAHSTKGIPRAHPMLNLFFDCYLLVGANLIVQLPVDLFLAEQ